MKSITARGVHIFGLTGQESPLAAELKFRENTVSGLGRLTHIINYFCLQYTCGLQQSPLISMPY